VALLGGVVFSRLPNKNERQSRACLLAPPTPTVVQQRPGAPYHWVATQGGGTSPQSCSVCRVVRAVLWQIHSDATQKGYFD
jgi:hypothetical protein